MKKLITLFVATAFAGSAAVAFAQTSTAPAPAAPAAEKKADKAADKSDKKMASKSASGTVKSASADSLVVKGKDADVTFAMDAKTKVKKGGKDAAAGDLKEGDSVSVKYMEHEGKKVAQTVTAKAAAPKKAEAKPAEKK